MVGSKEALLAAPIMCGASPLIAVTPASYIQFNETVTDPTQGSTNYGNVNCAVLAWIVGAGSAIYINQRKFHALGPAGLTCAVCTTG